MTAPMPDLYELFSLDRSASAGELGAELAVRDQVLEQQMVGVADARRRQLQTAYGVLGSEQRRAVYDGALGSARSLNWNDLEHLSNFGTLPGPMDTPQPQQPNPYDYPAYSPQAAQAPHPGPAGAPFGHASFYAAPVPAVGTDRPSAGLRLGMMLLDSLAFSFAFGLLFWTTGSENAFGGLVASLVGLAWFLSFEVLTGASPVKHLFGYEVRDTKTGDKLTWEQSAKRQWWRVAGVIPLIGWLVGFVGAIGIGLSIKPQSNFIGSHDRWAGAEVVRKSVR